MLVERKTATNIGLTKAGLTEVIEHLYFYQHLCLIQADVFQMPCLRQAPNRCASPLQTFRLKRNSSKPILL